VFFLALNVLIPTFEFGTPTSDFRTLTFEFGISTSGFRASTFEFGTSTFEFRTSISGFRTSTIDFETSISGFETSISGFGTSMFEFRTSIFEFGSTPQRLFHGMLTTKKRHPERCLFYKPFIQPVWLVYRLPFLHVQIVCLNHHKLIWLREHSFLPLVLPSYNNQVRLRNFLRQLP
jgi:hypothetical protein